MLEVTDGQDRGARFALHGREATLGRAPTVDVMLTDPRVAPRHAVLSVTGDTVRLEPLDGAGAVAVNGTPVGGDTALRPGDRILLGDTEVTVRWAPGPAAGTRPGWPQAAPPPPPPPPVPPPPRPAHGGRDAVSATGDGRLPVVAAGLAALAVVGLWVPVVADAGGGWALICTGGGGLRALAVLAALGAAAAAAAWLAAAAGRPGPLPRGTPQLAVAACGGVLLGIALFLSSADPGDVSRRVGVPLVMLVAVGLVACGGAGATALVPRAASAGGRRVDAVTVAAGAVAGGLMAAAAPFLTWLEQGVYALDGFDRGVLTARGLLPLALATVGAGLMAPVAAARIGRREGVLAAAVACALAGAVLSFGLTAAAVHRTGTLGPGAGLAAAAGVIALVPGIAGALGMLASSQEA